MARPAVSIPDNKHAGHFSTQIFELVRTVRGRICAAYRCYGNCENRFFKCDTWWNFWQVAKYIVEGDYGREVSIVYQTFEWT